jgi:hypothetical protein
VTQPPRRHRGDLVATPALRYWRLWAAHSQATLAADSGVSLSIIRRLEHGGRTSAEGVQRLTDFLKHEWSEQSIDLTQPLTDEQKQYLSDNQ